MLYELLLAIRACILKSIPGEREHLLTSGIRLVAKFEDWQHGIYYSNARKWHDGFTSYIVYTV